MLRVVLQSSYIFLKKPESHEVTKNENGNSTLVLSLPVISHIKTLFPSAIENGDLWSTKRELKLNYMSHGKTLDVTFEVFDVVGATYVNLLVSANTKLQAIECLESIQTQLFSSTLNKKYVPIISYDAISEYYCNKIYPKLNELERNLRHLLFNTYIVNFGRKYYSEMDADLQNKIKQNIQAKGSQDKKEEIRLQNFFYSFEFNDVQKLLFTPRWTETDEKKKQTFLDENSDLSHLSDEDLRSAFSDFTPKSDWERFFSDKMIDLNLEQVLEEVRKHRNAIAHCKFFGKEDFKTCSKAIQKMNRSVLSAINITEEKDFADKNREALRGALTNWFEGLKSFTESVSKTMFLITHNIVNPSLKEWQKLIKAFQQSLLTKYDDTNPEEETEDPDKP